MADAAPLFFERRLGGKLCKSCGRLFTRAEFPRRAKHEFAKQRFCSKACASAGRGGGHDARFDASYAKAPSGCWIWQKYRNERGYGTFCLEGRREPAHRYAYERTHGPVPSGLVVMHKCDNPPCVNPAHLTAGTQLQNLRDAKAKGRIARGDRHGASKLSEAQARQILTSDEAGATLARHYGISQSVISGIRNGTCWRHL